MARLEFNSLQRYLVRNSSAGIQFLLVLDIWIRTMIWAAAFGATLLIMSRTDLFRSLSWDTVSHWGGAWVVATTATNFILLFNVVYILTLVAVRLPFPRPRSGVYRTDRPLDWNLLLAAFLAVLTKARFQPPFPGIFVSQLAGIVPFRWLLGQTIGPMSKSSFFVDPGVVDPWGVEIGRNVTIGLGSMITCHLQERDYVIVDRVIIEDDVSIGAYAGISCGVHIKRGAVIEPYAAVKPRTVIGEYEFWGGRPAFKKGTFRPSTEQNHSNDQTEAAA